MSGTYNGVGFTLKRKQILTHVATWVNFENIMIVKQASHRKTNTVSFHICEIGNRMVLARNQGQVMGSYYLMRADFN